MNEIWINTALKASIEASRAIMEIYARDFKVEYKSDHSPVTVADKTSSKILVEHLNKTGVPIISEEEVIPNFNTRKNAQYVWLVDPLDGTKEFIRKNGEFCICIALINNSQQPVFGLIASPTEGKVIMGGKESGVFYFNFDDKNPLKKENRITHLIPNTQKTIAYSRSHFTSNAEKIFNGLEKKYGKLNVLRKGSALKFIDLALGRADFYLRMAPTMEWDIAAGQAIYEAIGGEVLEFANFDPLIYNKESLYNPFFIAKNKDLML